MKNAIAAEWTKLWSVRATTWCLIAAAGLMAAMVAANGIAINGQHDDNLPGLTPTAATEMPVEATIYLVQFAMAAIAALAVTGEYAHRGILPTLQAVPVRWRVPAAKAVVTAAALFACGVLLAAPAIWLADVTLAEHGAPYTGGDVVHTLLTVGLYLALVGVLTIGIATALRHIAATLLVLFTLLMVLPVVMQISQTFRDLSHYVPGIAGIDLMEGTHVLRGALVLIAWAAAAMITGMVVLRKRDA
ncbi:ABC transporter permease [Actinokineospora fastidiosa]|uniref:ABC transporter permease n=1 Tax=Actinokineospora fastidiosa TaxID=1816 RepID=A0A918GLB8_9PSEU|nr:ABC transporter permease [Actinokineospora fastidiosa]GGS44235.1 ABC transporter permease [Actinokineospora fastidiosa]